MTHTPATIRTGDNTQLTGHVIGASDAPGFYRFLTTNGRLLTVYRQNITFPVKSGNGGNDPAELQKQGNSSMTH